MLFKEQKRVNSFLSHKVYKLFLPVNAQTKTESPDVNGIKERLCENHRLLHAAIGVSTESAEILDQLKKLVYYGRDLDKTNLFEETGDLFWYLAILADELGFSFEEAMASNVAKLKARYGDKFTKNKAINRDLDKELEVLK